MKPERFKRTKAVVASCAIALVVAAATFGVSSVVIGPKATSPQHLAFDLVSSSCPASPLTAPNFSVCGPVQGSTQAPVLYPGATTPNNLPLRFYNSLSVDLYVTSLTVSFAGTNFGSCDKSKFSFAPAAPNTTTGVSGTQPNVTLTFATGHYIDVSANSVSIPGATYDATLALANDPALDQTPACKNLPLSMTYTATAQYSAGTCITKTTNGGVTVTSGQIVCITGRVNGGITVQSGGSLDLEGANVNGGITATSATALTICGSTINGNISATGTKGFVLIGDDGDDGPPGCSGNSISGNVTLTNGTGGFEFSKNTVIGNVSFTGNTGNGPTAEDTAPEVEANKITGSLSCATSNIPALTDDHGKTNSVSGTKSGQCGSGF